MSILRETYSYIRGTAGELISSFNNALSVSTNDGAGSPIDSTAGALNVFNTDIVRDSYLHDNAGNPINSTSNALNVFNTDIVRESRLHDGVGNPIDSTAGALHIHDAEIDTIPFNEHFHRHTGVSSTLSLASSSGDTSVTVANGALFAIDDYVQLEDGIIETTFPRITAIATNLLTFDRPLDYAFSIGDAIEVVDFNMVGIGTLASPISYIVIPDLDQVWHLHGFTLSMLYGTAGDDSNFGDGAELPNGVILRAYNGTVGQFRTFTLWKTNADIGLDTGTTVYKTKAPSGQYGLNARGDIEGNSGAIPSISGALGDYIEILVQDDLSGLTHFIIKAQGHVEL